MPFIAVSIRFVWLEWKYNFGKYVIHLKEQ